MANDQAKPPAVASHSTGWTLRRIIFVVGITLWLGSMFVQTRLDGLVAIAAGALLLAIVFVATVLTRTVTAGQLISPLCLGGAMLGLAVLAGRIIDVVAPGMSPVRDLTVPFLEEVLKTLPVLWICWLDRDGQAQSFGAADLLLLAAASGVGFGMVEEAFIRHNEGWAAGLWWLPTSEIVRTPDGANLIVGHAVWTGLAGVGLGLALLLRGSRMRMVFFALSGVLWSAIDHTATNYGAMHRDVLATGFRFITGAGWTTAYLFLAGVIAAVALDLYAAVPSYRRLPETRLPRPSFSLAGLRALWAFERLRRQFAYAVARYRRETGLARARAAVVAAKHNAALVNWQLWWRNAARPRKASA